MKKMSLCTNCKFRTTDGCGPGPVMICGHEHFKSASAYEDAIISWKTLADGRREAVSNECPWPESENVATPKI